MLGALDVEVLQQDEAVGYAVTYRVSLVQCASTPTCAGHIAIACICELNTPYGGPFVPEYNQSRIRMMGSEYPQIRRKLRIW